MMENTAVVIMAGGKGKRMKSDLPKVLHEIAGRPILSYIFDTINKLNLKKTIMIVGYQGEKVRELIGNDIEYAEQSKQLGTAHAVLQSKKLLEFFTGNVLILSGDVPFLKANTLRRLLRYHQKNQYSCSLISAILENPWGYGRIIRNKKGEIREIIEEADLNGNEKEIKEVNAGIYCFKKNKLFQVLEKITPNNKQNEYYLTDAVKILLEEGLKVGNIILEDHTEMSGINTRIDLVEASKKINQRVLHQLMLQGVTIIDPASTFIEEGVQINRDTTIYPFTIIQKESKIGQNCIIGPYSHIINAKIGNGVKIWSSIIEDSEIKDGVKIGPYSHLRPGTTVEKDAKIGNFVEVKKSIIGEGSKASHLTYLGDAKLGKNVNVGAGTITCNYDGEKKNTTIIEDDVFIGSNNALVAPVKLGKASYTGAGSTITENIPENSLAIARSRQKIILNWKKNRKIKNKNI
ncbi:MAG: bifunctional UDP-N-acetylglucosamine diphosphorylase/glucosamine-1-phosphate N-acetyltransferase GlmU [Candidatus Caldatribacteriota bacterium]|nr:bifunctional UDP-N-acetylglucosamine diphosphorylase/glucosamine-1-phosphate N-acetyltransferase GlmU [Candidatus Caldatribacteriota bacterium]